MLVRARYNGQVLIPVEPVELPLDRVLEMDVREVVDPPVGSGAAILAALRSLPPLEPGDIEAFERELEAAERQAKYEGIFDEDKPEEPTA
jgi:hypothetical protein